MIGADGTTVSWYVAPIDPRLDEEGLAELEVTLARKRRETEAAAAKVAADRLVRERRGEL